MAHFSDSIGIDKILLIIACLLLVIWLIRWVIQLTTTFPGIETKFVAIAPSAIVTRLFFISIPGICWVNQWTWLLRYEGIFGRSKRDIVAVRSLYPTIRPTLLVADAVTLKAIGRDHIRFPKPLNIVHGIQPFGPNLVGSNGDEWRRHRRIAGPSFTETNNRLVWEASMEVILGFFNKWVQDGKETTVYVEDTCKWTEQMALMIFTHAGFGLPADWDTDTSKIPEGHSLSLHDALRGSVYNIPTRAVFPKWMLRIFARGRQTIRAFEEMEAYMQELIEERQSSVTDRGDLLTNLIRAAANEEKSEKGRDVFTRQDLMGNIHIFLFAGHETTAHTLTFALALMAMHPQKQEWLYKHIRSAIPEGRLPTYADIPQLAPMLSWIYETLRLYPIVNNVSKEAAEDCMLPTADGTGIAVPKGTILVPLITALHYNPKYWDEPQEFKPDRFLGEYDHGAFMPFSMGARICIGRRFSEVEQIAILSTILLGYKIEVMEEPQFAHESLDQRRDRVLGAERTGLTLAPNRVPLAFKPREGAMMYTSA